MSREVVFFSRNLLEVSQPIASTSLTKMPSNSSKRAFDLLDSLNGNELPSRPSPNKKSRVADTTPLWEMITGLQPLEISTILYNICSENPSLTDAVRSAHAARLAEERKRPPAKFESISKDCWHTLNTKYKHMHPSKQFDVMGDIDDVLNRSIASVLKKSGPETRWETRRNALEVLRKISKSIMLCDAQQIRHELMKDNVMLTSFAEAMLGLAQAMTAQERERYKEEGLYEKLVELQTECEWECDMPGLREIYELFDGDLADDDDYEEEGNPEVTDKEEDEECQFLSASFKPPQSPPRATTPPQRTRVFSVIELD